MLRQAAVLFAMLAVLAPPVGAQPGQPPTLDIRIETDSAGELERQLTGRQLWSALNPSFTVRTPFGPYPVELGNDAGRNRAREGFAFVVGLVTGQQQRMPFISSAVRRVYNRVIATEPNLDKLLAAVAASNPDIDITDPRVLKILRRNGAELVNTLMGILAEPNSIALLALVEPDLAARAYQLSLKNRLERRGTWDPPGNAQLEKQIAAIEAELTAPGRGEEERLVALQRLLRDQGIPIPDTIEGGQYLAERLFVRFEEVLDGKNRPVTIDVIGRDPTSGLAKLFARLDERIARLESGQEAPAAAISR
ncbi:hypothetical protein [Gloeobacter morelensis]|uniref:DUF1400 domain-containing protein n=1 Tax=Gloeobacter morelensis MG652769 TaxID=2781736 RepID=A0ABY3PGL9_9CYAN|nr:hypothetical protein [Gloeobacter morelensis]UFP92792.1 hypothetical protein ISF26_13230 [Gloeobacter morelensis MG652769]